MLTHLSLFTGIGGIDLAAEMAGFQTVGQCELGDFQTKVLAKHWPNVVRWRDVKDVTADSFQCHTGLTAPTLITAGYPCQRFSLAGKRTGELDLANEFVRVVGDLRPTWALGENVYGHVSNGLDGVMRGLEEHNYETWAFTFQAADVGAPQERQRVFVVAYSSRKSDLQKDSTTCTERSKWNTRNNDRSSYWRLAARPDWPIHPSGIFGTYDGLPNRVDRSIALGNAVVPQQVYPILKAIADIEMNTVSEYESTQSTKL